MIKKISFVLAICVLLLNAHAQVLPLIPQPNKVELQKGNFTINKNTIIHSEKNAEEAAYLKQYILENYGLKLKVTHKIKEETNTITFLKATEKACENNKEEYQLNVSANSIKIFATSNTGIFYGIQTLIQLLPIEKNNVLC